jgi:hypothetical protein
MWRVHASLAKFVSTPENYHTNDSAANNSRGNQAVDFN